MITYKPKGTVMIVGVQCDTCSASLPAKTMPAGTRRSDVEAEVTAQGFVITPTALHCPACAARTTPVTRPSLDTVLMLNAQAWAQRGTCTRKKVGAVIALDGRGVSTGYNGSMPGQAHCTDAGVGCLMEEGHCVRTVHAELNAILHAARHGIATDGGTIYTTASPCFPCFKAIVMAGLRRVVFAEIYRDERITQWAEKAKIELVHLP